MLVRSQRPLTGRSLEVVEQFRKYETDKVENTGTFLSVGLLLGLPASWVWGVVMYPDPDTFPFWVVLVCIIVGGGLGHRVDKRRKAKRLKECEEAFAAKWGPTIAAGFVDHLSATATKAVRLDAEEGDSTWFLQVEEDKILCVGEMSEHATEGVEIDCVQSRDDFILSVEWTGARLTPVREKRFFKYSERYPEDCEILTGRLEQLDELLWVPPREDTRKEVTAPAAKLARDLEPLGFYKFVHPSYLEYVKKLIGGDAAGWLFTVERAFQVDPETIGSGIKDYLDYLLPALRAEGCEPGPLEELFDDESGYRIRVGTTEYPMWSEEESEGAWQLAVERMAKLINVWLAEAGSLARFHLMGEDGFRGIALLSPEMLKLMAESKLFNEEDFPRLP